MSVGRRPRTRAQAAARPAITWAALTIAEPAGLGANGGDQWFMRNSEPVVPPRLGRQLASHCAGSVSSSGWANVYGVSWTMPP